MLVFVKSTVAPLPTPTPRAAAFSYRRRNVTVRGALSAAAFSLILLLAVQSARADDSIDPSLIPDGTYPAHVDRVVNGQRVEVTMQGSLKVVLDAGRKELTFADKVKTNDVIAVTLADGKVMAFKR